MITFRKARLKFACLLALAAAAAIFPSTRSSAQSATAAPQPSSPNGKIVFQSDQAGGPSVFDIYTMDADGRHETRLTDNTADDVNALWSRRGNQIAFASNRRGGFYEIFLMSADGSNQRPLRTEGVNTFEFVWSPDGSRVAFTNGNGVGFNDVFVVNSDGSSRREANYTKTRRADEFAFSWQRLPTP